MAYAIHIERVNDDGESLDNDGNRLNPIALAEWQDAVTTTVGVRLTPADTVATNPHTGETIRIPGKPGDAEVFFAEQAKWVRFYSFFGGAISFKPPVTFEEVNDPVRNLSRTLASALGARMVGDGGEVYD